MMVSILANGTVRSTKESTRTPFATDTWLRGKRLFQNHPIMDGYILTLDKSKVDTLIKALA